MMIRSDDVVLDWTTDWRHETTKSLKVTNEKGLVDIHPLDSYYQVSSQDIGENTYMEKNYVNTDCDEEAIGRRKADVLFRTYHTYRRRCALNNV